MATQSHTFSCADQAHQAAAGYADQRAWPRTVPVALAMRRAGDQGLGEMQLKVLSGVGHFSHSIRAVNSVPRLSHCHEPEGVLLGVLTLRMSCLKHL